MYKPKWQGESSQVGERVAQPEDVRIVVEETPLSALMMLSSTVAQQALQAVLDDDEPMMQVENSPPEMIKSAIEAEEEVREIKSPEKPIKKSLRDVGDISAGEGMSGENQLISLGILGQGSTGGEASSVNVEESRLEAGGGDQSSNDMEELQRILAIERGQAENVE